MPKPQIHKSMIGMFDRCPKQYEQRYVEGLRIPPASAMIVGSGVHGSAGGAAGLQRVKRLATPARSGRGIRSRPRRAIGRRSWSAC